MSHALLPFAKQMRHAATEAEARLWKHLRAGRQGFAVQRFWNDEILRNTDAVLDAILRKLEG